MPKTTPTKQKTNNSSSSGRPIPSRTRKAARDSSTNNNSSSTTRTNSSTTTPSSNSSSNNIHHRIPIKKSKKESDPNIFSRRIHYISCSLFLTVDTYLEPLHANKKSVYQVEVGNKYHITNPFSDYDEVQVDRISPDGKMCAISRINLNKTHEFKDNKNKGFLNMQFEFNKGKSITSIDALRNQLYCRKKTTKVRFYTSSGCVSSPIGFKQIS